MAEVIDRLAVELVSARNAEALAKEKRIQIEGSIIAQFQLGEAESKTVATGNGLKLTLKTGLNYKLLAGYPKWIPVKKTEKVELELDAEAYEALRINDETLFAEASEYVVVTAKKPAVTVSIK